MAFSAVCFASVACAAAFRRTESAWSYAASEPSPKPSVASDAPEAWPATTAARPSAPSATPAATRIAGKRERGASVDGKRARSGGGVTRRGGEASARAPNNPRERGRAPIASP